ncbi:hypothetical protein CRE_19539 [Caenorhabditis remanei]|uniref:Glycosyltransferase family 92 protein n=1 Tax=Caenorhabditis remanei TaxID=31234 RepID=E3NJ86_CAERE|nr:hypothetical protein CRE_19539 [Caenorhabditis remanei]
MRRGTSNRILYSLFILVVVTFFVLTINIYTGPFSETGHENEITPASPILPKSSEMRRRRDLSLKEAWLKKRIQKSTQSRSQFNGIYVREAYRVSDEEIRFVYLENQDNNMNLQAEIPKLGWQPVEWFCFNASCYDYLFCSMATRFGSIRLPQTSSHQPYIHLTTERSDEYTVVPVNDVRLRPSSHHYPHTLGVCLQPIFFFTDWTVIMQFFESWIAQGATKFYFYLHSYTWQTKKVLDFYKDSLGDGLELLDWSDLPVHARDKGMYDRDPNSRVFRHGATAFMHDCMMRARSVVKFVANTDLDDLPVSSTLNLPDALEKVSTRHPDAAQFKVDWILSHQPQHWDSIHNAKDVNFDLQSVRVLKIENIRWDYRVSKKMFHRPERVMHFDMHSVYRNELAGEKNQQYTTIEMFDNSDLYFLHLRQFERHLMNPLPVEYNNSFNHSLLMKMNTRMLDQYTKRIDGTEFAVEQV